MKKITPPLNSIKSVFQKNYNQNYRYQMQMSVLGSGVRREKGSIILSLLLEIPLQHAIGKHWVTSDWFDSFHMFYTNAICDNYNCLTGCGLHVGIRSAHIKVKPYAEARRRLPLSSVKSHKVQTGSSFHINH